MSEDRTLIVAFDGLDYDLIQDFALSHIPMDEFGEIDVSTNTWVIATNELFASFCSGTTFRDHGVYGLRTYRRPVIDNIEQRFGQTYVGMKTARYRRRLYNIFGIAPKTQDHRTLPVDTWFDIVPNTRALFVPAISPVDMKEHKLDSLDSLSAWEDGIKEVFRLRKKIALSEIEEDYNLLMIHIQYPDAMQHIHGDTAANVDAETLSAVYAEIDRFAKEIKDVSQFDKTVFMSDHGLPTAHAHNPNAFYSLDWEENLETPHITDFYDPILKHLPHKKADAPAPTDAEETEHVKTRLKELGYL